MKERAQKTLHQPVELSGVGLHTGVEAAVRLLPGDPDTGIVFRRTDLPGHPEVPARLDYRCERRRCTALQNGKAEVQTVEHLLAALHAFELDNVVVEISGPEVPGLDGSSLPFVEALRSGRVTEQKATQKIFTPARALHFRRGDITLVALPREEGLHLSYTLSYDRPRSVQQTCSLEVTPDSFATEIAPARTFVTEEEVPQLREAGLGKGASEDNTLVISSDGEQDAVGLRFSDEYARHKLLDLLGDLCLLGRPLHAQVMAYRSGHEANAALVQKLSGEMHRQEDLGYISRRTGFDIHEIMRVLPHRYPFLLVDRVVEIEGFKRAVGLKNVTINEPFFMGHFPGTPIMPAVLTLESLAQLAGILLLRKLEYSGKVAVFLGMDKVRLRRAVVPGDQLRLVVETLRLGKRGGKVRARATVRDHLVAEAEMKFMLVDSASNVEDEEL